MNENQPDKNIEVNNGVQAVVGDNLGTVYQNVIYQSEAKTPNQPPIPISPEELREAVCQFLGEVEEEFKYEKLFHNRQKRIIL